MKSFLIKFSAFMIAVASLMGCTLEQDACPSQRDICHKNNVESIRADFADGIYSVERFDESGRTISYETNKLVTIFLTNTFVTDYRLTSILNDILKGEKYTVSESEDRIRIDFNYDANEEHEIVISVYFDNESVYDIYITLDNPVWVTLCDSYYTEENDISTEATELDKNGRDSLERFYHREEGEETELVKTAKHFYDGNKETVVYESAYDSRVLRKVSRIRENNNIIQSADSSFTKDHHVTRITFTNSTFNKHGQITHKVNKTTSFLADKSKEEHTSVTEYKYFHNGLLKEKKSPTSSKAGADDDAFSIKYSYTYFTNKK